MAAKIRRQDDTVIDLLEAAPQQFELFQAIRLIERLAASDSRRSASERIGEDADPAAEAVRLRSALSLSYAPSDIGSMTVGGQTELTVAALSLLPPTGLLPLHDLESALGQHRRTTSALRAFLDIFHHRALSFLYRAWKKYRLPVNWEGENGTGRDPVTQALYALVGLRSAALQGRLAIKDEYFLHFAGPFANRRRSVVQLEALLCSFLGEKVEVRQFQSRWFALPRRERSVLPSATRPEGSFCQLGVDAVIGKQISDAQSAFRICLGPCDYKRFKALMPGTELAKQTGQLVNMFVGLEFDFDIQVSLHHDQVPAFILCSDPEEAYSPRLGWNTWLWADRRDQDVDDAVFRPA